MTNAVIALPGMTVKAPGRKVEKIELYFVVGFDEIQVTDKARLRSAKFQLGIVQHLLEGTHQHYDVPLDDPSAWIAVWMYLDDYLNGKVTK